MILPVLSASYAVFALTLYVMLDGFDLGVGMLLLFQRDRASRDHMVDSITPTWDGNETWLILAGVTLLAGFPVAYGILMPALYVPLIVMLLSLGLRGVSFEFRVQTKRFRPHWDRVFAIGSLLAALMQGMVVGTLLQGVTVQGTRYSGGMFAFLHVLPLICGVGLAISYMVLGAGWLHLKGKTPIANSARRLLRWLVPAQLFVVLVAVIYAMASVAELRAVVLLHRVAFLGLGTVGVLVTLSILLGLKSRIEHLPFILGLASFLVGIAALGGMAFPYLVPFALTIWDAAAPRSSQLFVLVGAFIVTPMVLTYSLFAYWVFRGKTPDRGWGW
jgi:cytochrome bd ubiquinol oxidase subunit II